MSFKKCNDCKELKPMDCFHKNKHIRDGKGNSCKDCVKIKNRIYQRDKTKNRNSDEYRRNASLKFRTNNLELHILSATKSRAKKRNLAFNLDINDIVIPEFCPYLQIKLTRNVGKGRIFSNPSVDRINNNKGYIKGNIQIISDLANVMKRNVSVEQLVVFSENVLKLHKKTT